MLSHFRKVKLPCSLLSNQTRSFSQVASLTIEPTNDLYETFLKEEFTNIYSTNYQSKIPGFATSKGTKYYSLRRQIGNYWHSTLQ